MTYDTLEYNGTEQAFADWGLALDSVQDQLTNQANDVFSATIAGANIATEADSPTFPFEATVIVRINRTLTGSTWSGGAITFTGKRVENPAQATGGRTGVTYKFHGPWYDLANTHYLQTYKGASSTPYLAAETILNTSTAVAGGTQQIQISLGDQIQGVLQWLLDTYATQGLSAPFQYLGRALNSGAMDLDVNTSEAGSPGGDYSIRGFKYNYLIASTPSIDRSLFNLFLPSYITKPLMCADALRKCLELSPRICVWFDYTQSPPMINFTAIDLATPQSLALFDGTNHKSLNIQARNDLLVNAVRILYRINNTVGGSPVVDYSVDKWGPHGSNSASDPDAGLRVINELIDLQGFNATLSQGHLDVEPLECIGTTQAQKLAWWASQRGGNVSKLASGNVRFQDATGAATTIPDAVIKDSATGAVITPTALAAAGMCDASGNPVLNRLVRGTHHAWMTRSDGVPVVTRLVKVSATMTYAEYDSGTTAGDTDRTGNRSRQHNNITHEASVELTNGTTGAYTTTATTTAGEDYLIGAGGTAQYLYNQMNTLQFEGDFVKVESAFGTGMTLGAPINFTGGAAAWTAMKAQPQEIRRHYGRHETSVRIGVAKHLNSGQLSALLNMWRFRRTWYNPALRTNNSTTTGGTVDQPITAGNASAGDGVDLPQAVSQFTYATPPSGTTPGTVSAGVLSDPNHLTDNDNLN